LLFPASLVDRATQDRLFRRFERCRPLDGVAGAMENDIDVVAVDVDRNSP
jgi:hypothetical protein